MIKKINHVAIVTPELEQAKRFWVEVLGLPLAHETHVAEQQVDIAFLPVGECEVELLQPTDNESGVARYLQKRGPGIHHICFEVEDIAAILARLKMADVPLIDETPRLSSDGTQYAFIHPKGAGGVLVELYQLPES